MNETQYEQFLFWYKHKSGWYSSVTGFAGAEYHLAYEAWKAALKTTTEPQIIAPQG